MDDAEQSTGEDGALLAFLDGGGEMGGRIGAHDFSDSPLPSPQRWPSTLKAMTGLVLGSGFPMFLAWGEQLTLIYNDAYAALLGPRHPHALGRPFSSVWRESWPDLQTIVERALAGEASYQENESIVLHRHGRAEEAWFTYAFSPARDARGRIAGILGVLTETTGRVLAERDIRTERDRTQGILQSIGEAVVVLDADGRVIEINAEALRLDRRPRDGVIGLSPPEAWPGLPGTPLEGVINRALIGRERGEAEHLYGSTSRGEELWIDMRAYPTPEGGATVLYRNITQRRTAEVQLRESELRFRRIADSAPVPMWVTRLDRKREFANLAYVAFLGVSYDEALGFDWRTVIHPDDAPRLYREQSEKEAALTPFSLEGRYRRADGAWRWLRSESQPRFGAAGEHTGFIGVAYDVTDAKRAQADLERINELLERRVAERTAALQDLYDKAPVPLHSLDSEGRVISVSDRWLEFMSYDSREEVLGRASADFLTEESRERLATEHWPRLLREGQMNDVEYRMVKRSGETADVLISSRIERDAQRRFVRTMGAVVDVTARRRAEEQLRQAQKMEAVGQLTGGIAHDFNNLLTAVIGSLDLLRRRPGDEARQKRLVDTAMAGAERGAKLTRQLLAFARTQKLALEPVDVAGAVRGMVDLLHRSIGPSIALRLLLDEQTGAALADANQLENALLNLVVNARDAMPDGGEVTLTSRRVAVGEDDPELAAGAHVELSVADTGGGMSPEVLRRAFDPFFTTKETGKGTGLGLSQVYGFARQSGGAARIDSRPGAGTTVRILLRAAGQPLGARDPGAPAELYPSRRERVLVIDDDAEVRSFLVACIEDLGYRVSAASGGAEGLALLAATAFDLVLTDYAMPGMTGADVARRIRAERPDLPIVFATGYADMEALEAAVGDAPVLHKPFGLNDLGAALRNALLSSAVARGPIDENTPEERPC